MSLRTPISPVRHLFALALACCAPITLASDGSGYAFERITVYILGVAVCFGAGGGILHAPKYWISLLCLFGVYPLYFTVEMLRLGRVGNPFVPYFVPFFLLFALLGHTVGFWLARGARIVYDTEVAAGRRPLILILLIGFAGLAIAMALKMTDQTEPVAINSLRFSYELPRGDRGGLQVHEIDPRPIDLRTIQIQTAPLSVQAAQVPAPAPNGPPKPQE